MNPPVRYQVFVSSTYDDLREERQQATQAVLEFGGFPSGMELFPASDESQWDLIKRVITEADYYIVIVGGRYGSEGPAGISFTEMEYDFAVETGIPVLGFVKEDIDNIPSKFVESDKSRRVKLERFRKKVMSRTCRKFRDSNELGMAVIKSLMHEARVRPRIGWVRADQAWSEEDRQRESKLVRELGEARKTINSLERDLRDHSILKDEISREDLSQEDDFYSLSIRFQEGKHIYVEDVDVTWNELFGCIGPSIFGYIVRKYEDHSGATKYPFQRNVEELLRSKVIDRVGRRKIELREEQIDTIVFQFKELGYIKFSESETEGGSIFRGVTLTEDGEKKLSIMKIQKKHDVASNLS